MCAEMYTNTFLRVVDDGAALRYIYYLLQHGIVAHRGVYGQFNSNFKPTKMSIEHMKGTGNVPSLHALYVVCMICV